MRWKGKEKMGEREGEVGGSRRREGGGGGGAWEWLTTLSSYPSRLSESPIRVACPRYLFDSRMRAIHQDRSASVLSALGQ